CMVRWVNDSCYLPRSLYEYYFNDSFLQFPTLFVICHQFLLHPIVYFSYIVENPTSQPTYCSINQIVQIRWHIRCISDSVFANNRSFHVKTNTAFSYIPSTMNYSFKGHVSQCSISALNLSIVFYHVKYHWELIKNDASHHMKICSLGGEDKLVIGLSFM
uniref:Uncharacterized protein n=1 Tax=Parascaris univalens TaxID=6257 RepID=A0A915C3Y1_PARUN